MAKRKMPSKNTPKELREIPEELELAMGDDKVETVVFNCRNLNVRTAPEKKDNVLFVVAVGERLTLLKDDGPWSFVESTSREKSGWVLSEFLKTVE